MCVRDPLSNPHGDPKNIEKNGHRNLTFYIFYIIYKDMTKKYTFIYLYYLFKINYFILKVLQEFFLVVDQSINQNLLMAKK